MNQELIELLRFNLRVFSEVGFLDLEQFRQANRLFTSNLYIIDTYVNDGPGETRYLDIALSDDLYERLENLETDELKVVELINVLTEMRLFFRGIAAVEPPLQFINFGDIENYRPTFILSLLENFLELIISTELPYGDHFWGEGDLEINYTLVQEGGHKILRINVKNDYLNEYMTYSLVKTIPGSCEWWKVKKILHYHHAVIFGRYLIVHMSRKRGVYFSRYENSRSFNTNHPEYNSKRVERLETNRSCGIPAEQVFIRAISRYLYKQKYSLLNNNCEHFGSFCFYGMPYSKMVIKYIGIIAFFILLTISLIV